MKGFQTLFVLFELAVLFVPAVATASYGVYQILWGRADDRAARGATSLIGAALVLLMMYKVFATAPAYDFIDYCHLRASGCAMIGEARAKHEAELRGILRWNFMIWVLLPVAAATGVVLFLARPGT